MTTQEERPAPVVVLELSTGDDDNNGEGQRKPTRRGPPFQRDIPGLGTVTLKSITVGDLADASKVAVEAEKGNRPETFTNLVLSRMIANPPMSADEVGCLPLDVGARLVEIAVDRMAIRKEFENLPPGDTPQENLYRAHIEHRKALLASLKPSFELMKPLFDESVTGSVKQVLGQLSNTLPQLALSETMLKSIAKSLEHMTAVKLELAGLSKVPVTFQISDHLQQVLEYAGSVGQQPLQKMIEDLGRMKIREPFLSDTLFTSGLNAPLIHSPTYTFPVIQPVNTIEDVRIRARDAKQQRLGDAYDIFSKLELSLRELIESKLREQHGSKWWKRGVPEAVRQGCEDRKQKKEKPGEDAFPPIYYAYIDDYKTIIVKLDNWQLLFAPVFSNRIELEACFAWVGRVRDSTAPCASS